jgi:hypothetical protein
MLTFEEKIKIFKTFLEEKQGSYADKMKDEIYFYFFENEWDFKFLNNLNSIEEIENKIEFVVVKMIMNEHLDGLENIMSYQFFG